MECRRLGATGLKVSPICFGTATFGWHTEPAEAHRMLDAFLDHGCNFVDTADYYSAWAEGSYAGRSEEIIGQWFAGASHKREHVVLATKVCSPVGNLPNDRGLSRGHIMDAVENSLRRLQTDHIDLYQAHALDEETPIEETLRAFDDLVHQGKVRYLGCSNFPAWRLCRALWKSAALGLYRFDCVQPYYNLVDRAEFEREAAPLCLEEGIAVIPYSPLAMGFLTGKHRSFKDVPAGSRGTIDGRMPSYFTEANFKVLDELERIGQGHGRPLSHVALAWLLAQPFITSPIVGARSWEQLAESVAAADLRLTPEEVQHLSTLTDWRSAR